MKYLFFSILSLVLVNTAKGQVLAPLDCKVILKLEFKKSKIEVCGKNLDVEIADNDAQRAIGLMCRESLPDGSGMLFIFNEERELSFWMKNTKMPLSIGYFDKNQKLIDIHDMEPMNAAPVTSSKPAKFALEVNKGWYNKNKIKPGCSFQITQEKLK